MTTEPPPATPDDKDWTWVLAAPCPDCGYRSGLPHAELAAATRANVQRWQTVLRRPEVAVRPADGVWSPLEYACHVRDVYRVFAGRLRLMLESDDPVFENWDQDETARQGRYWAADPARTSDELGAAGADYAAMLEGVRDEQWQRAGRRSNGSVFTVQTLAWYQLHDDVHHLWDVGG